MIEPTEQRGAMTRGALERYVSTVGAAAILIGAFLPWATFSAPFVGTVNISGIEGDGKVTAGLAIGIGALSLTVAAARRARQWIIAMLAVIAGGIAAWDGIDVQGAVDEARASTELIHGSVGVGIWVTIAGAVLALVGCQWLPPRAVPPVAALDEMPVEGS